VNRVRQLPGYAHFLHQSERERKRERLNFYACKGAHTLFTSQRKREGEREREREREGVRVRKREGERESAREREV
jgi:hypothetical protein